MQNLKTYSVPGTYPGTAPQHHRPGQRRRRGPLDLMLLSPVGVTEGPFLVGRLSPSGRWVGRWQRGVQATPACAESRSPQQ